jgi:hypothetical protein
MNAAQFSTDIPVEVARGAFNGTSFSPERIGDTFRREYGEGLEADVAFFNEQAVKGGTVDQVAAEFERYRAGVRKRFLAYMYSQSRCVSSFIAGPSNFPARRMNKRADISHKRLGEYLDFKARARRAVVRNLRPDLAPIMSSDADAVERLEQEVDKLEQVQARMRNTNAAIRKNRKDPVQQLAALVCMGYSEGVAAELLKPDFCGRIGFADYQLTNNSANIRRIKARIEQITAAQTAPVVEKEGANARIEDDPPANRVRLFFPGKPPEEVRAKLKKNGFRWAPSVGAWQAYRNSWSLATAVEVAA